MKNLLKEEEEDENVQSENMNYGKEIKRKKKKEAYNEEYYKGAKERLSLRQGTLDAFLNIK